MNTALVTLFSLTLAASAFAVDSAGGHDRDGDTHTPGASQDRDTMGTGTDQRGPTGQTPGADARTVPGADTPPGSATDRRPESERDDRSPYDVNGNDRDDADTSRTNRDR